MNYHHTFSNARHGGDDGDDPVPPVSTVARMPAPDEEELSLLRDEPGYDEEVQEVMRMTAPRGERLTPGAVPAQPTHYGAAAAQPVTGDSAIVAQLAHEDVDDVAARVAERLERRMTERLKQEVQRRVELERSNQMMAEQLAANQAAMQAQAAAASQKPPANNNIQPAAIQPPPPGNNQQQQSLLNHQNQHRHQIQYAEETSELDEDEYDIDDNFKICGFRRTCWGLILTTIFLVLAAGLTSTILHFTASNESDKNEMEIPENTESPTPTPDESNRWQILMDRIGDDIVFDSDDDPHAIFKDTDTPQYRAFNWLVNNDKYKVNELGSISNEELVERYALASLYYTTLGLTWKKNLSFMQPISACDWNNGVDSKDEGALGVYCDNNRVTFLQLVDNGLKGTIPREVGLLTSLKHINLDKNVLYGELPELGQLTALEILWLSSNNLMGTLPVQLAQITSLASIDFEDNSLSGSIPVEWGASLTNLFFLGLRLNDVEGNLPDTDSFWENLSNLRFLDLEGNSISGPIPTQLGFLTRLESLYMEKNRFDGPLPSEMGRLTELSEFLVFGNRLVGTVPVEYASLTNLQYFWIHATDLSGSIDNVFCTSPFIQSLSADCHGDPLEIECSCCSQCCNAFGEDCQPNKAS